MKYSLPSFHSLRAFEAAARFGAFNKAADELGLTATAISHHIRQLEQTLGTRLFSRTTRRVSLTDDGKKLADACGLAFDLVQKTTDEICQSENRQTVTIALGSLLASRWLTPRLSRFWETFPTTDIQLMHTPKQLDPKTVSADIYIIWGEGNWPGFDALPFLSVRGVPVASPQYLDSYGQPSTIKQLANHQLIHQRTRDGWRSWMAIHGAALPNNPSGIVIEDANVALRSAIAGQGIALAWFPLAQEDVDSGRLVPLFSPQPVDPLGYYLISVRGTANEKNILPISAWLKAEADKTIP